MLLYLLASLDSVPLDPQEGPSGGALAQRLGALLSLVRSASLAWRFPPAARRPSGQRHHVHHHLHHRSYLLHHLSYLFFKRLFFSFRSVCLFVTVSPTLMFFRNFALVEEALSKYGLSLQQLFSEFYKFPVGFFKIPTEKKVSNHTNPPSPDYKYRAGSRSSPQ